MVNARVSGHLDSACSVVSFLESDMPAEEKLGQLADVVLDLVSAIRIQQKQIADLEDQQPP